MKNDVVKIEEVERIYQEDPKIELGQWYWVFVDEDHREESRIFSGAPNETHVWFACVVEIGSNYAMVQSSFGRGTSSERLHLDTFYEKAIFERNPEMIFAMSREETSNRIQKLFDEVKAITLRLGVSSQMKLSDAPHHHDSDSTALVVSRVTDVKRYEDDLKRAKDTELPELFEKVKEENDKMSAIMQSEVLPMEVEAGKLKDSIGIIKGRIFNVSLYAGLSENVVKVRDGKPGEYPEKIHLMQRRLYMDEECLLDYKHGGMELKDIHRFDKWISKESNMKRILPFSKCIVAFRIRRHEKHRRSENLLDSFINIQLADYDKITVLYLRNGEQLFRMDCDLEFDEMIFPDVSLYDTSVPMMFYKHWNEFRFISVESWKEQQEEEKRNKKKYKQWEKENPDKNAFFNPYRDYSSGWEQYEPLTRESVYFDDAMKFIKEEMDKYNRVALIIQGLLDRSEVFHPHPEIQSWKETDFNSMVKLVRDGSQVLNYGEKPDIKAYIERCNSTATKDSHFIGQEKAWLHKMAQKENERRMNSYRYRGNEIDLDEYRPYGDPGPGYIARPEKAHKNGTFTFVWERERRGWRNYRSYDTLITSRITVPLSELFNVDGYTLGDFKQFFMDPRTRGEYLSWAGLLLSAEEFLYNKKRSGK